MGLDAHAFLRKSRRAVDTDHIFYELFREHPDWLRELTGLPLPQGCKGSSQILKQLEIRCDLLLEPSDPNDPFYIVEFQLYHDHSIFNRIELARQVLWKHLNRKVDCRKRDFQPREVETVIIFGSKTELPHTATRYPMTRNLFIDELLEALEAKSPDSPLLAALSPLNDPLSVLEMEASRHYDLIQKASHLNKEDREVLHEIFLNLLLQRFKTKSLEEIRVMIAELTPIKETRVGKELFEEGIERGTRNERQNLVRNLREAGMEVPEIAKATKLDVEEINDLLE
jgi:predicted transposase YdaD